jgi:hypothetical protein
VITIGIGGTGAIVAGAVVIALEEWSEIEDTGSVERYRTDLAVCTRAGDVVALAGVAGHLTDIGEVLGVS